ncbi:two-component system, CitB family, sensor histidine kinase DctS [Lachnospiraceae bacterium XBB1006]|nr:two-component system, CitB family, sensor histidine kinase DctS [Lachnospiraceae bacterium XBB1006]
MKKLQKEIIQTMILLAALVALVIAIVSIWVNVRSEGRQMDSNLQNMAQAVAKSQMVSESLEGKESQRALFSYLDSLQSSLENIDVISVVDVSGIRRYHTNKKLVGTTYDGTKPDFTGKGEWYVTSDEGPSGSQRRAYAAVYNQSGEYAGFVLAVMLERKIHSIIIRTVLIHVLSAASVLVIAILVANHLTTSIKRKLKGYEPDTFSAMFSVRDNILESLEEGIIAMDLDGTMIYQNEAAQRMLREEKDVVKRLPVFETLKTGKRFFNESLTTEAQLEILADLMPVMEQEQVVGALVILRDRTEYTKLSEDLTGVRYLVDSMRANNHDFMNKLHVILGLIQMGQSEKACEYIANVTSIQQNLMHQIVKRVEDPSVAALLIGKYARAAELNIQFSLETGSKLARADVFLPSSDLVTLIGNLVENSLDALNQKEEQPKELTVGIFSKPQVLIVRVDDTGVGISEENRLRITEKGFSTKGENRGTGMYLISELVKKYHGTLEIDSEEGEGTSIMITLRGERSEACTKS